MTLHGWLAEFIAVAAKRPVAVTAPHPPRTVHVGIAPVGRFVTVNCCVDPTPIEALVGERTRLNVGCGVVLTWK
jgi:hypothetical protein